MSSRTYALCTINKNVYLLIITQLWIRWIMVRSRKLFHGFPHTEIHHLMTQLAWFTVINGRCLWEKFITRIYGNLMMKFIAFLSDFMELINLKKYFRKKKIKIVTKFLLYKFRIRTFDFSVVVKFISNYFKNNWKNVFLKLPKSYKRTPIILYRLPLFIIIIKSHHHQIYQHRCHNFCRRLSISLACSLVVI